MVGVAVAAVAVVVGWPAVAGAHEGGRSYRWVGDDAGPEGRRAVLPDDITDVWTADLQAVLSLSEGGVTVDVVPRAVELPEGAFANGNAYEVTISAPRSGELVLVVPDAVVGALHSADGRTWAPVSVRQPEPGQLALRLVGNGLYVAVADHDVRAGGSSSSSSSTLRTAVLLGGPGLLAVVALVGRRRRTEPEPVAA